MIEHFQNDRVEGIVTKINGSGKHTMIQPFRSADSPDVGIMFYTGSPDVEHPKNEDGTDRYKDPVYLHLHSVSECQALIRILALAIKELGGEVVIDEKKNTENERRAKTTKG